MTISIEYEADKVLDLPYREIIENTVLAALDYEKSTGNTAGLTLLRTCCPFPWWIMSRHRILTMWRRLWRITSILKPES